MNDTIEKLGRMIERQLPDHPDRAARLLSTAYSAVSAQTGLFPSKRRTRSREYLQSYTARLLSGMLRDPSTRIPAVLYRKASVRHAAGSFRLRGRQYFHAVGDFLRA